MAHISVVDWWVIGTYLFGLMAMAVWLSRTQEDRADYYVGGRAIGPWPVAISILATQCSTNSILGAPAFVAFAAGGGLVWLQYELALPLAMIGLMLVLMPMLRQLKLVSVYEFIEHRYDLKTRLLLSGLFLWVRAFATAVTVYSIAIVVDLITGIGFFWSVVILGVFTVVYDVFGGIKGVIYSDVIQMLILVAVLVILFFILLTDSGGFTQLIHTVPEERLNALDFAHHGFGDGQTFAFWPMLFGGLFLYLAYYGCDQSQVQRELSTKNIDTTNQSLLINGLLRFPLVLLYCFVGVGIAVFAVNNPEFLNLLPTTENGTPQYNLAVPAFMISELPIGLVGLGLVALFAAAMSSLDSVLNSLSATTMEDFVVRFRSSPLSHQQELWLSRLITVIWGIITLTMAFFVGDIAPTVLEAINKIGSLANGSILAVFTGALVFKNRHGLFACFGLVLGIIVNGMLWQLAPDISWLWWNPLGFFVTLGVISLGHYSSVFKLEFNPSNSGQITLISSQDILNDHANINWYVQSVWLIAWFFALLGLLWIL
ncbi:sodium:solute symporter [Sessilibacter corallicola]|uniref:sodium:solute symporter n=1 Tax=Sessilibacter corallicola TaxID=2904075 RepID=UPI001E376BAF|nr:sodium:solute symporter [Sessilibacter corallicola]MCE2028054.1 sodium:solute symporter [Sessilibacter corallicola]